jgi:hypothetical protein
MIFLLRFLHGYLARPVQVGKFFEKVRAGIELFAF